MARSWTLPAAATLLALLSAAAPADAPIWREDATRIDRDHTLHLAWANANGDWTDADGAPMGSKPWAAGEAPRGGTITVKIDVTRLVRAHGADFRLNSVGGTATFTTREGGEGAPKLSVTRGGTTRVLDAAADTTMDVSTFKPLGDRPIMSTRYGALVRFDQGADPAIDKAVLILSSPKRFFGDARILVFRPAILNTPQTVATGATYESPRRASVRTAPQVDRALRRGSAISEPTRATRVLTSVEGAELPTSPHARVVGRALEAWIEGHTMGAISEYRDVPGAPTDAYLTVVLKLDDNWTALGGKLPGLANTGDRLRGLPCVVRGQPMPPAGWGGRIANACHWSARTGYLGVRGGEVGAATYFYAMSPKDVAGINDWWSAPLPKGRWVAYVERVKLNDPGRANGEIAYWLVDRASAPGGRRVQAAGGIVWRDTDQAASAINTLWADVFCGGRDCGAAPWPRSTVYLRRLTVTNGLPDLGAIQAELDRLNAGR